MVSDPVSPVIFTADFHLDPAEPDRIAQFIRFTRFVARSGASLYLLGDLFNFWIGSAQARIKEYRPLLKSLRDLSRSGRFTFLHGNRDFMFAPYWQRRGGKVIYDGTVLSGPSNSVVLYHGDAFCTGDIAFQKIRSYYHKWWGYYFGRLLPVAACMRIGRHLRGMSRPFTLLPGETVRPAAKLQRRGADLNYVAELLSGKDEVLVCGHFHCRETLVLSGKTRNVPAYFLPENTGKAIHYLWWEDPEFTYRQFGDDR